jgi:hypothetical protein
MPQRIKMVIQNNINTSSFSNNSENGIPNVGFRSNMRSGARKISMSVGYNSSIYERMTKPGCSSCGK